MAELSFLRRNTEAIVTGLIVVAIVGAVTAVGEKFPQTLRPFAYGIACGGVVLLCCLGVILVRRTPRRRVMPSEKNIEVCVRTWLDNHKLAVTNDPIEGAYFRYRIELPGDKEKMTILRMESESEHPEYVQILADLGMHGDDVRLLDGFSRKERLEMLFEIKLQLAHLKIAYSGLVDPPLNFMLVKKVPIYAGLTESEFMSAVWEVEAAMHVVGIIFLKAHQNNPASTLFTPPPVLDSGTPKLGPR